MTSSMIGAKEVQEILLCSESKAYEVIRILNRELQERGYLTLSGKVSAAYLHERFFGMEGDS